MEQIDILMATYNGEKYLKQQIESILKQTYKNFRLIISDDCSNDNTREIIKQYEKQDERIISFFQEQNLGYVKNFEFLLTKVESEIYMLSDQDDVWNDTKIEHTYNKLKESNADLVFTDLEVVNEGLKTMYPSFNDYMKLTRKIKKYDKDYKMQYLYNCITGCTLMSKKKFLDKILPIPTYSKYVIHDTWIGLIVSIYGKVTYLGKKTIKYRQHDTNQVGTNKISHRFNKLEDVRNLFIEVKLGVFGTYVQNQERFPEKLQKESQKALEYFENIKEKKNINFKNWNIFHKLYKTESLIYYLENFLIMNLPVIGKILFKIRLFILKICKKR